MAVIQIATHDDSKDRHMKLKKKLGLSFREYIDLLLWIPIEQLQKAKEESHSQKNM
jgi:hypothetical protein